MAESQQEYIRRIWRESLAEVSVPHPGNCAVCGGPGTFFPYLLLADGTASPITENAEAKYAEGAMVRARFFCPCCSKPGCTHRTPRERQMDRALAVLDAGGKWKQAAEAAGLSGSRESQKLIAFWKTHRRLETPAEYTQRCIPSRRECA